jgi:hypothetical protein
MTKLSARIARKSLSEKESKMNMFEDTKNAINEELKVPVTEFERRFTPSTSIICEKCDNFLFHELHDKQHVYDSKFHSAQKSDCCDKHIPVVTYLDFQTRVTTINRLFKNMDLLFVGKNKVFSKIHAIKAVRNMTAMGLKHCKDFVENEFMPQARNVFELIEGNSKATVLAEDFDNLRKEMNLKIAEKNSTINDLLERIKNLESKCFDLKDDITDYQEIIVKLVTKKSV